MVLLSVIVAILFVFIALLHLLLALGFPLGEFAMGGYYKILPLGLKIVSIGNALFLLFMAVVFLHHTNVFQFLNFMPIKLMMIVFSSFLVINTLGNIFSKSKKERSVMTPISSVALILCWILALS